MKSFYFVNPDNNLRLKNLFVAMMMVCATVLTGTAHATVASPTTCDCSLGGFSIINLNNSSSTALSNGAVLSLGTLPSSWNIEIAGTGNTAGSVKFTLTGTVSNTVIENAVPFRYTGDTNPANLGVGSYTLKAEIFTGDNASGSKCDTKTISFSIVSGCQLAVNAGPDKTLCNGAVNIAASVTGAKTCTTNGVEDCTHSVHSYGGYIQNSGSAGVCGDNAGAKLWTKNDNTTAWIIIDLGSQLPAGTEICTSMKLEHCGNTSSNYSSAKIQASASAGSGYSNLVSAVTFSHTSYQNYCYTLSSAARYIKISDNGHCSIRVDYVKSTTPSSSNSNVNYSWSGPGIVGASNQSSINANQAGTYTVTATNCDGTCTATDQVIVSNCPPVCTLSVNAGSDVELCSSTITLNASSTGAKTCTTPGTEDCNHTLSASGGWLENANSSAVCGDNTGTKLWTKSGQGTSWITIDLGTQVAAGTQVCVRMKLEHCSNTSTNYSNAKIEVSANASSGFSALTNSVTFTQTSFQDFCYNLSSASRYIKISDNGNCAFRVDYVKYITTGSSNSNVTYSWSGPGIVGASNQASINVNQVGTYTVTAVNCDGTCSTSDQVVVNDCPPTCALQVNAGADQLICGPLQLVINSTVTGASSCTTTGTNDCNHTINSSGGWLENVNASAVCGDNTGTKLWTKSGQGTSWINIDLGTQVPAGTQICVRMKLEHCSNTSTSYSNAKIEASANASSGFSSLTNSVTFTQTSFQDFCYTLAAGARYIKISDNGNCAFRVDYVKYTTTGLSNNTVTYSWSGPGIVGASNGASVTVNQSGTYVVIVADCNGCVDTDEVQIINDSNPPVLTGVPANITVQCADDVPAPAAVTAWDNINGNIQVIFSEVTTGGCPYAIIRTWTATDNCGNQASATQNITVHDTIDPILHGVPSNLNLSCDQNVPDCEVWASDNCDQDLIVTLHAETINQDCGYQFVRTWSVTDACGNIASASQTINFYDNTNPTVLQGVPASLTIECDAVIPDYLPTFEDNCDEDLEVEASSSNSNQTACGYDINRTWVATDDCGNSVTVTQVIHVVDTTDPILVNVPANTSVSCDAIPAPATVNADDNCSDATVAFNEVVSSGCPYTITRTWTAVDACGNTASATQVIIVYDNVDPVLHGVPANITLECDQQVPAVNVFATDNCTEELTVSLNANTVTYDCGSIFTRTWSVVDACGNEATASQVITFVDTTNPYIVEGVPAELTIECDEDVPSFTPVFGDNCDEELEVHAASGIAGVNSCGHNIERSWTAVDNCGNEFTVYQVIHVVDTTNPELVGVPANTTVECDAIPVPANVTAIDNCSEPGVQMTELTSPGCPYTITRRWVATDECGNQSEAAQVITVVDTTDPIASNIPTPHITVECSDEILIVEPTFTDNCDEDLQIEFSENEVSGSCIPSLIRTWIATDDCGNATTISQIITIVDTTAPVLVGVPSNTTVECDNIPAAASVTAEDLCDGNVEVEFSEVISEGCPYTITRTWYAIDHCENEVEATQIITVIDTTFPVLHGVPADITLECDQPVPAVNVSATDNCTDELEVSLSANTVTYDCGSTFTRTWTVADACGNETIASQVITFVDTTNPYIVTGVPVELTIECDEDVPSFTPVFGDNCDEELEVHAASGISGVNACGHNIERSWTATDNCGNYFTVYQVIHVVDTTNPELVGVPVNTTVECDAIPVPANVTATDNCSEAGVELVELASPGCPYTITRRWVATDECGNQSLATQIITVIDTTNPVLIGVPANATVECSNIPAPVVVTADDNCSEELEVVYTQTLVPGNACTYTLVRTWTVEDACGNETSASQILTVTDTIDPTLEGVPANITVECDAIPAAAQVTGDDNCDESVAVSMEETTTDGCPYTITRTWTGVDNCGNDVSASQIITVIDTTFPVLHGVPADIMLECDQPVPAVNVSATDNCTDELEVSLSANTVTYDCGSTFTRTWSVADACGNETIASQVITFVDTTNPYIVEGVPAELTIECDEDVPSFTPVFGDNCDEELEVHAASGIAGVNSCGHNIERSWTAVDNCGNEFTVYQVIHVVDTTNPELVGVPANTTVECDAIPAPANVTATDNCSEAGVELVELASPGCPYTITRTWTATDECGNQSLATQIITVIDTTNPVLIGVPANATVECSNIPAAVVVTANDNCSEELEVVYTQTLVPGNACTYTLVRTWTVEDACGNETNASQILTVTDTIDPTLEGVPANITVECDAIPAAAQVTGDDNCDESVAVSMEETTTDGCPYTITRTWTGVDNCGNDVSASQIITVIDTTFPVLHGVPSNITLECDQPVPAVNVSATDNCTDELEVSLSANTVTYDCGSTFTRTWTVVDACGNETTASQVITFVDTTNPYFNNTPANVTVECDAISAVPFVSASDNCDSDVQVSFSQEATEGCPYTITRTWTAIDNCENETVYVQTITVVDTTNPVITAPADITVECSEIPVPAVLTATDNCDTEVAVAFEEEILEGTACEYTIIRSWTATDNCGNQSSDQQVMTVVDTTYPVLVGVPTDVTAECDNVPTPSVVGAIDNCSSNLVVTSSDVIEDLTCGYIITRTYSVSDDCGNTTTQDQIITVADTTDPIITSWPANITIECGDIVEEPGVIEVEDNCDNELTISFDETTVQLDCGYQIIRTWTVADDCENSASVSQIINVTDETNPVITGVPADITIECDETVPAPVSPTITDNCDNDIVIQVSEVIIPQACGHQIIRTYRATDNCGNSTVIPQVITVVDTTNPEITAPADVTVTCDNIPEAAVLEATDNCTIDVNVVYNEEVEGGCPYTIVRTWTATDDCGNQTSVTQLVHVYDEVNPVFDSYPSFVTVECDQVSEYILTATDNCDSEVEVSIISELQVSGQCYGSLLRTYQAVDNCGNTVTAFQIVDIIDSTAPELHNIPADATVTCGESLPTVPNTVFATDNCSSELNVVFSQVQTNDFCPYDVIRTWSVSDDCGNVTTASQTIHVTVQVAGNVNLQVYPNPAREHFNLQFSVPTDEAHVTGEVLDVTGKSVYTFINGKADGGRLYNWDVNARSLNAGVYYISLKVGNKVINEKLMILGN